MHSERLIDAGRSTFELIDARCPDYFVHTFPPLRKHGGTRPGAGRKPLSPSGVRTRSQSIRLTPEIEARLVALAAAGDRPRAAILREAIDIGLRAQEGERSS